MAGEEAEAEAKEGSWAPLRPRERHMATVAVTSLWQLRRETGSSGDWGDWA